MSLTYQVYSKYILTHNPNEMVISLLPVPFADAARQRQFEALEAALRAEAEAPATVLLGNLAAWTELAADALLVRPAGLVMLVLVPRAGHLTIPALTYGGWQLDGQPLPGRAGADSPFAQYQQQAAAAQAWLAQELSLPEPLPCAGIALFEAPLTFGPEVEAQLHRHAAAHDFQLVGDVAQLPARLRPPLAGGPITLTDDELLEWADYLAHEPYADHALGEPDSPAAFLAHQLRRLWRWLGAEDIPADPPYGGAPLPDLAQRDQQEQARLHQLRQELQAELHQHRQEAAAREAARTQELAQLRQQLAQANPSAAARHAEQRAQAALEESVRTARAELAAQSHALDARIRQLGQLMQQLQAPATAAGTPPVAPRPGSGAPARQAPRVLARPAGAPAKAAGPLLRLSSYRPLRRAERWSVLMLVLALLGGGVWGVGRLLRQPASLARPATPRRARQAGFSNEEARRPDPVIIYDTLASDGHQPTEAPDANLIMEPAAPEATPAVASPAAVLHVDTPRLKTTPAPLLPGDSTTTEASPAP